MSITFRGVALATCCLCMAGALLWTVAPHAAHYLWELEPGNASALLARRYAAVLCGVAVIMFCARNAGPSPAREAIALGGGVTALMFAVITVSDWLAAEVGLGMLVALALESILAACFISVWHADRAAALKHDAALEGLARRD